MRVLVVDDDSLIRWALNETLSDCGCEVSEASDAREARAACREVPAPFDVVLLDYRLPDSDDLSLLASIDALSPGTRVILMTAFGNKEMEQRAVDLGAVRVMNKPFDMNAVPDLVVKARSVRPAR